MIIYIKCKYELCKKRDSENIGKSASDAHDNCFYVVLFGHTYFFRTAPATVTAFNMKNQTKT